MSTQPDVLLAHCPFCGCSLDGSPVETLCSDCGQALHRRWQVFGTYSPGQRLRSAVRWLGITVGVLAVLYCFEMKRIGLRLDQYLILAGIVLITGMVTWAVLTGLFHPHRYFVAAGMDGVHVGDRRKHEMELYPLKRIAKVDTDRNHRLRLALTGGPAMLIEMGGGSAEARRCAWYSSFLLSEYRRAHDPPGSTADESLAGERLDECPACGYSLEGLPTEHACPECGQAYDRRSRVFGNLSHWEQSSSNERAVAVVAMVLPVLCLLHLAVPAITGKGKPSWIGLVIPLLIGALVLGIRRLRVRPRSFIVVGRNHVSLVDRDTEQCEHYSLDSIAEADVSALDRLMLKLPEGWKKLIEFPRGRKEAEACAEYINALLATRQPTGGTGA